MAVETTTSDSGESGAARAKNLVDRVEARAAEINAMNEDGALAALEIAAAERALDVTPIAEDDLPEPLRAALKAMGELDLPQDAAAG